MLYRIFLSIRHLFYDKGWKKSFRADVPTLCVGNLTAGGTGKTPHTELLLRTLLNSDDWAYSDIAVLSQGYRRRSKGFRRVDRSGTAREFGDEPLQMAKNFPSVTVAVDKDRVEGCRFLAHPEGDFPPQKVIVLDDAFQYRRLLPEMNIVLVDYNRPVFKDRLLPWGRLRDLPSRLGAADVVIVTKCPSFLDEWERGRWAEKLGIRQFSPASCQGVSRWGGRPQTLLFSTVDYLPMEPVFPEADSRYMYSKRLVLLTGIAAPGPLAGCLSDHYSIVREFRFPDHHRFRSGDIRRVTRLVKTCPTACVATTQKDAQRLLDVKKVPPLLRERLFQVPIRARFLTEEEHQVFEEVILSRLKGFRSES